MTITKVLHALALSKLIVYLSAVIWFYLREVLMRLPTMELPRNVKAKDVIAWK